MRLKYKDMTDISGDTNTIQKRKNNVGQIDPIVASGDVVKRNQRRFEFQFPRSFIPRDPMRR
jgi:hypothetical protein